jgi:hypothetical protein
MGEDTVGVLGGEQEMLGGAGEVARRFEETRQLGRDGLTLFAVVSEEPLGQGGTPGGPAARRQRVVERILVQGVDEAVTQR